MTALSKSHLRQSILAFSWHGTNDRRSATEEKRLTRCGWADGRSSFDGSEAIFSDFAHLSSLSQRQPRKNLGRHHLKYGCECELLLWLSPPFCLLYRMTSGVPLGCHSRSWRCMLRFFRYFHNHSLIFSFLVSCFFIKIPLFAVIINRNTVDGTTVPMIIITKIIIFGIRISLSVIQTPKNISNWTIHRHKTKTNSVKPTEIHYRHLKYVQIKDFKQVHFFHFSFFLICWQWA